jgi:hypothetical protein
MQLFDCKYMRSRMTAQAFLETFFGSGGIRSYGFVTNSASRLTSITWSVRDRKFVSSSFTTESERPPFSSLFSALGCKNGGKSDYKKSFFGVAKMVIFGKR